MKRLIDANVLLEKVQFRLQLDTELSEIVAGCVNITQKLIEAAPTIDAVEVVRCKDCKNLRFDKDFATGRYCALRNVNGGRFCEDIDFCSYGERREE